MNKTRNIALYMRLSVEDEDKKDKFSDSQSIMNQKFMLHEYAREHAVYEHYKLVEYVDDGYSGGTFDRPAMTELLNDIKNNIIHCIIVKDLSRFGRNYKEVGKYLDFIFPMLNIRFISINDHFDSDNNAGNTVDLSISFKNFLHEKTIKDHSKKVTSAIESLMIKGEYIPSKLSIGYIKSKDKEKIIIDEESAEIVKKIFSLRLGKMSAKDIVMYLNLNDYQTPSELRREKSKKLFNEKIARKWNVTSVYNILKNEMYTGGLFYYQYQRNPITKKMEKAPRSKWTIVKGTHEAIISKEIFDKVNGSHSQEIVRKKQKRVYYLRSLLTCALCGGSLNYYDAARPIFSCSNHVSNATCVGVGRINEKDLNAEIRKKVNTYLQERDKKRQIKLDEYNTMIKKVGSNDVHIAQMKNDIKSYESDKLLCYQSFIQDEIDRDTFKYTQEKLDTHMLELERKILSLEKESMLLNDNDTQKNPDENNINIDSSLLNNDFLHTIIDNIEVNTAEKHTIIWKKE